MWNHVPPASGAPSSTVIRSKPCLRSSIVIAMPPMPAPMMITRGAVVPAFAMGARVTGGRQLEWLASVKPFSEERAMLEPQSDAAAVDTDTPADAVVAEDLLVEEVSIDGMCGVY